MPFTNAISPVRTPFKLNYFVHTLILVFFTLWVNTLIHTSDLHNWFLENILVILLLSFLAFSYRNYQFSDLSYLLICIFLCLHVYGSQYTYAENPFGFWLQKIFNSSRNHYDRIVHFSFGFLLAYPMRELFLKWLKLPKWLAWLLPIEITLSLSGLYELVEWSVADLLFPEQGDAYLGSQGDIWDAQKDMFMATLGAIIATSIVSTVKKIFHIHETEI